MCNPTAAMVVMALVSTAASMRQQQLQAEQAQEQERAAQQAAMRQQQLQEEQLAQQMREAAAKAETDKFSTAREAAKQRGTIMAGASEAGAFGNLMLRELAQNMMQEGYDTSIIDYNLRQEAKNAVIRRKGFALNAENTINANKAPKTDQFLSSLKIGSAALNGAMRGYNMGNSMQGAFSTPGTTYTHHRSDGLH